MGGLHWGRYIGIASVMTVRLDEASTVNGNDLCGLVPNEKLFRPAPKPRPYWNGPTEVRTGFVIF